MQKVILLTEEEYQTLKTESPSGILQATVSNLKFSNEKLLAEVSSLKAELATYKLGGATPRPKLEDYATRFKTQYQTLIDSYNSLATPKIKESLYKTSNETGIPYDRVKQILKEGVNNKILKRLDNNTYIYID